MSQQARRETIVSQPVGRTLFDITVPMLFALIAIMGLGLADSYFISFLGTQELAAIGFIMPVTSMIMSVALGMGMAISSLTSKLIGAQKFERAARLITDGLILSVLISMLLSVILALVMTNVFRLLGAGEEVMPDIQRYMRTWLIGIIPLVLMQAISSTFRSMGDTKTSAQIAIIVTVINLILDPLLIFGLGPFPALGIQGAAFATVIAVLVSVVYAFNRLAREKAVLFEPPSLCEFKANSTALTNIGIPAVLANLTVPIAAAMLTMIVATHGTEAVAGFGVGARLEAVSLIVVYALSSTLPMFIGQNLGAGNLERIREAIILVFKFILCFQLLIYALLALFSNSIGAVFSEQVEVQKIIHWYLLLVPISYGVSGIVMMVNVSLNVLDKPRVALYINIMRLVLCYFPLALLGSALYAVKGIFIGIALANCLACLIAILLLRRVLIDKKITPSSLVI